MTKPTGRHARTEESRRMIHRAAEILNELFCDPEFRSHNNITSDDQAYELLDEESIYAWESRQLIGMIRHYPDVEDWINGDLRQMLHIATGDRLRGPNGGPFR